VAKYSLGEIDAIARKATRGAGYSWGIAEEVGKAVRWLSTYGFLGAETLAEHLILSADKYQEMLPILSDQNSEEFIFDSQNTSICALSCCALINDLGHYLRDNKVLSFTNMSFPILALPSAARVAEAYDISISFSLNDEANTFIYCDSNGIFIENKKDTPPLLSEITLSSFENVNRTYVELNNFSVISSSKVSLMRESIDDKNTHFPSPQSREISTETITILEKFAHKTYAPATEESRLRGAG